MPDTARGYDHASWQWYEMSHKHQEVTGSARYKQVTYGKYIYLILHVTCAPQASKLRTCIQEVAVSNPVHVTGYLTDFRGFAQSVRANEKSKCTNNRFIRIMKYRNELICGGRVCPHFCLIQCVKVKVVPVFCN